MSSSLEFVNADTFCKKLEHAFHFEPGETKLLIPVKLQEVRAFREMLTTYSSQATVSQRLEVELHVAIKKLEGK